MPIESCVTLLTRIRALLGRRLWIEHRDQRARRRARTLFGTPFAAIAGLVWGVNAAASFGTGSEVLWGLVGAFAMAFFVWAEQALVPPLAEILMSRWPRPGMVGLIACESLMVGGFVLVLTHVVRVPNLPGIQTALVFGAIYPATMEFLVLGGAAEAFTFLIGGGGRSWKAKERFSVEEALVAQGRLDEAAERYRSTIDRDRRGPAPYTRLSRVLIEKRDFEGAVDVLKACLADASLDRTAAVFAVRQIHELCATKLHAPERAVEQVYALLERWPEGPHVGWAEGVLRALEAPAPGAPSPDEAPDRDPDPPPAPDEAADFVFEVETDRTFTVDEGFEVPETYRLGDEIDVEEDDRGGPAGSERDER